MRRAPVTRWRREAETGWEVERRAAKLLAVSVTVLTVVTLVALAVGTIAFVAADIAGVVD